MKIPFNDLYRIHKPIQKEVLSNFENLVRGNKFVLPESIEIFEKDFAKYTESKNTISCSNGTDAIELILRSLDITFGDEVIIPVNTFIATALAVSRCGATPIFVDHDEFFLMNVEEIEKKINHNTKAIIAVNLYGQIANIKKISEISKRNKLYLIEDAAQSHGAKQENYSVGKFSDAAAYSFYPGKNLGAWGDGGAITTNSNKIAAKAKLLRNWGSVKKYEHDVIGFNSRLQPVQGFVLSKKLEFLNEYNEERQEIANYYLENLAPIKEIELPKVFKNNKHVWHLFVIKLKSREYVSAELKKLGIETIIHYPIPINKQKAYSWHFQAKEKFSNSDKSSKKILSLPIFPKMKKTEYQYVVNSIVDVLDR